MVPSRDRSMSGKGEKMRFAVAVKCAGIVIAMTLAGCSSLNPFARKSEPRDPPASLVEFKSSLAVHTAWTTTIGSSGTFIFSPAFANGSLFVAAADGSVARINPGNGRPEWRVSAGMPLTAGVSSDGNTVAVAGEKGAVLVFDGEGKLRWKAQASSEILSAPAVGQGLVIVRSLDNRIVAFDADSGARRWTVQRSVPALTLRSAPGIVIGNSTAYVALPGGKLLALTLANGGPRWEAVVGDPRGATELERIADTSGLPVLLGREVCTAAYQARIACFDAASGAVRWAKELSSDVGLGADERERGAERIFPR
jgi:outer membrane protein assembly factor BamB